ncbi:hypothetical protein EC9_50900 [Rosistilla ulvae]|uniref:FHA domain-containing protein n=1 Tax=Rosistilla ulvae TaxID=1930277 RepID=A0A517M7K7_9BACT|nr:FHA domain-containing protein [Rosistilla ulvae]QDS90872.1 hypothetical protein EC9_50900 [Rosistilla ulvae]
MSAPANTQKPTQDLGSGGPGNEDYLEFQVDRVGHPRRRLRLSGQSYTFGSGDGCSVRLEDSSLRKTHAILIRQQDRLLVRGYGIAILVNGIRVTEAWLEEGDNLQLGDYTLTLLQGVRDSSVVQPPAEPGQAPAAMTMPPGSPFAEAARHFIHSPREGAESSRLSRNPRKEEASASSRLSFADGMRLVSKTTAMPFDAEDYFHRATPLAAARKPAAAKLRPTDPQEVARLKRLERMQEQSSKHAEAAMASSAASTHAVETLADKLDSLFEQLADNSERMRSDALQQQLETANAKHASQLEAFVQLTDRVSVLETAVDRANREARQHREKHEQALIRIQQLESQLSDAIAAHSERQASWELETAGLRDAIADLNRQLSIAQDELAQQQKSALSWRKQLDDAIVSADKSAAEHAEAIAKQVARQEELQAEHARVVEELASQHRQQNEALTAAHAQTIEDLRAQQQRLEAQLADELAQHEEALAREQAEYQQGIANHVEQNEAAAAKISHLEAELSDAVTKYKNHQQAWESEAKELNATIEQIGRQMALSETKFNEQRERADHLQTELAEAEAASSEADAEVLDQTAKLNEDLQKAHDRLAALRVEQAARQSSWQLEREELEYKISHQAAELSQFAALRESVNPQEEATVANRLAARLQAEVNRLHQDQSHETEAPSQSVDGETDGRIDSGADDEPLASRQDDSPFGDSHDSAFHSDDDPSAMAPLAAFSIPSASSIAEPEVDLQASDLESEASSFEAVEAPLEQSGSEPSFADCATPDAFDGSRPEDSHGEDGVDAARQASEAGLAGPSGAPVVDEDSDSQRSVYHSMTAPDADSDHQGTLQIDGGETTWEAGADDEDVANTYVVQDAGQLGIVGSDPSAFAEGFEIDAESSAAYGEEAVAGDDGREAVEGNVSESSFGSYDEAAWGDAADGLVVDQGDDADEISPWGEDDDEALSGLAAEMIGEFNRDAPQAGSFADLSESSTYDPTALEFDASMTMGFSFPVPADSPESEDLASDDGSSASEAFPSIQSAASLDPPTDEDAPANEAVSAIADAATDEADSSNDLADEDFAGQTQMMPEGGYSVAAPQDDVEPTDAAFGLRPEEESSQVESHREPVEESQVVDSTIDDSHSASYQEPPQEESYYGSYAQESQEEESREVESSQKPALLQREVPLYEPNQQSALVQEGMGATASDAAGEEDEDSIEAYMNRLLKRMHGGADEPEPPAPAAPQPGATPVVQRPEAATDVVAAEVVEEVKQEVMHESEYVPRSAAPEHSANLNAMRELANSSARQAIAKSVRNRQRSQAILKLFLSGAFIMGSGTFAVLAQRQLMPYSLAAGACVLLAVYWGLGGLKLLKGSGPSSGRETAPVQRTAAPIAVDEQPTSSVDQ